MPTLFWTGKLSPSVKLMANISNALAWITGNARDTAAMKLRVKKGYEGVCTEHVTKYDGIGQKHYNKIATELLKRIELKDKEVLDVGCGTGILSLLSLKQGAARVVGGDLSEYMLNQCRMKANAANYNETQLELRQFDTESLPFDNNSFDVVAEPEGVIFLYGVHSGNYASYYLDTRLIRNSYTPHRLPLHHRCDKYWHRWQGKRQSVQSRLEHPTCAGARGAEFFHEHF